MTCYVSWQTLTMQELYDYVIDLEEKIDNLEVEIAKLKK